ncbi:MAG: TlyA family RNA methyltransferase [Hyphomicrobium sp.]|jgi:23S rRNA (cytidine1920-2'-O)/16S rRNA (cytidine1409-2'-O)-methyltransferase
MARDRRRLDQLLVERGLAETRSQAQALIVSGSVFSEERRLEKPGHMVAANVPISVRGRAHPWVSRGGIKLAYGLDHFAIDPGGLVCLDIGASTGGFTHVLLTKGAARVYAVDVGHGQLAWTLRQDPRVTVLERTNARVLGPEHVADAVDLIVCDVSFISLEKALPAPLELAAAQAWLLALIKPQFEAGRGEVGKGGVVRDPAVRAMVCERLVGWLSARPGWTVLGLTESPITGPEGNVEYLIAARKESRNSASEG